MDSNIIIETINKKLFTFLNALCIVLDVVFINQLITRCNMVYLVNLEFGFSWLSGNIFNDIKYGAYIYNDEAPCFIDLRNINIK